MKSAARTAVDPFAAIADELGALEKEMAPHAQKLARVDLLRKTLREACTAAPESEWTVTGARFIAVLGMRGNTTLIAFPALVKIVGAKVFATFATCTLKELAARVSPVVAASVTSMARVGPRPLKTFEKGVA